MNDAPQYSSITSVIMRRWAVVVAVSAGAMLLGFLVSLALPERFAATATVLTAQEPEDGDVPDADRVTKEQLALTFADIGRRPAVLEPAAEEVGLPGGWKTLRSAVTIRLVPRTLLLEIEATGSSPEQAERRADAVSKWLISETAELSPFVQVQTEPGRADLEPFAPNPPVNAIIAGGLGFLASSGALLARETMQRRRYFRLAAVAPVVGRLPRRLESPTRMAQGVVKADSQAATWLDMISPVFLHVRATTRGIERGRRIAVVGFPDTPIRPAVSTSLAVAYALEGADTALVDLDFRHPSLHKVCGSASGPGVSELMKSKAARPSFASTAVQGLRVLPNGHKAVPNAALLTPRAIDRATAGTDEAWAMVFDVPVRRTIAEFALISEKVDAMVLVLDEAALRRADVGFLTGLSAAGVRLSGLVVLESPGFRARLRAGLAALAQRRRGDSAPDGEGNDRALEVIDSEEHELPELEPEARPARRPSDDPTGEPAPAVRRPRPAGERPAGRTTAASAFAGTTRRPTRP